MLISLYLIGAVVAECLWSGVACESCGARTCSIGGRTGRVIAAVLWLPILVLSTAWLLPRRLRSTRARMRGLAC